MAEFKPITRMAELLALDPDRVIAGYRSGVCGESHPGTDKCRGFHHGYRNGRVDGGFAEKDAAQMSLARDYHVQVGKVIH